MTRHPFADALFCESRPSGNDRLGTVIFPNGSIAVLPGDGDLQTAVLFAALEEMK